jgi:hypothetical protein
MDSKEQAHRYEQLMGAEARARQEALAKLYCNKCGKLKADHHPLCPSRSKR